jgi:hypothetical protein
VHPRGRIITSFIESWIRAHRFNASKPSQSDIGLPHKAHRPIVSGTLTGASRTSTLIGPANVPQSLLIEVATKCSVVKSAITGDGAQKFVRRGLSEDRARHERLYD